MNKQALSTLLLFTLSTFETFAQVAPPAAYSSNSPINYIRVWNAVKPTTNANDFTVASGVQQTRMTTQYFDGLGRLLQAVNKEGSMETGGTAKDLVSTVIYDEFGREIYNYLPFAANNTGGNASISDGLFKLNPFQQQAAFAAVQYPGETYFYGKTNYEQSPLNRVTSIYGPGNSWIGSENTSNIGDRKGLFYEYQINKITDSVRVWEVNNLGIASTTTSYPAGTLYKNIDIDANKNTVVAYKDKGGKVILRKVMISNTASSGHTGWLCTYYVYDNLNNLRLVVPPKATREISSNNWILTQTVIDELCFKYEFDERSRPITKKVPGAAEVRMVHDARDRVVLSQDGNLRKEKKWVYTKYDPLNRPIATGVIQDNTNYNNHSWHRTQAQNSTDYPNLGGYTYEEYTSTFYDNYAWRSSYGNPLSGFLNTNYFGNLFTADNNAYPYPQAVVQSSQTIGLVTGTRTKVLGTSVWLYSVNFYDDKSRLIQVQSQNLSGGTDISTTQNAWFSKPIFTIKQIQKGGTNPQTTVVLTKLSYDDLGRLIKAEKKVSNTLINNGNFPSNWIAVAQYEYNSLGKIKKEILGTSLEALNTEYNIRGWSLGVNRGFINDASDHYFGYELGYDKTGTIISGANFLSASYNGIVSGIVWKSKGDKEKRKYDFSYDGAKRLLKADFNQYTGGSFNKSAGIDFSVIMGNGVTPDSAYDYNGNILRMQQWGLKGFSSNLIDDLHYTYLDKSNKLKNVIDGYNDTLTNLGDFRSSGSYMRALGLSKNTSSVDYNFDDNGNIIKDLNKDITDDSFDGIEYNFMNLPSKIRVKDKGSIEYVFDAAGNKLKKTVKTNGLPDKVYLYLGDCFFENDTLQFISHEQGRIRPIGDTALVFDYFIKDHLGNVRMVLTEEVDAGTGYYASLETANQNIEEQLFSQIPETQVNKPSGFDSDNGNQKVAKLFNASGNDKRVGPGIILKVMAGDKFRVAVKGWYLPGSTNVGTLPGAASIVNSLIASFSGNLPAPGGHYGGGGSVPNSTQLNDPISSFVSNYNNSSSPTIPKGYLNWIVLDEVQFKLISGNYGAVQIPEITGVMGKQVMLSNGGTDIEVGKNGYLYVYVSNESQGSVYFDDLTVVHTRGPLLEETHYYPFGLTMAGISSKALEYGKPENKKFKFQNQELNEDLGANYYEFKYRNHDYQIGRFIQIDPLSDDYTHNSTYAFSENKVTSSVEIEGLESKDLYRELEPVREQRKLEQQFGVKHEETAGAKAVGTFVRLGLGITVLAPVLAEAPSLALSSGSRLFWWAAANPETAAGVAFSILVAATGYEGPDLPGPADDFGKMGRKVYDKLISAGVKSDESLATAARNSYNAIISTIDEEIKGISTLEGQAQKAYSVRQNAKDFARELSGPNNKKAAEEISQKSYGNTSGPTFNELYDKYYQKAVDSGLSGEEAKKSAYQSIIDASKRPNEEINKKHGVQ